MSQVIVNGAALTADRSGALVWPAEATLIVADLHLEKGSGFAQRGTLLPPYDSASTLLQLAAAIDAWRPRRVLCLGDSFHDRDAAVRLGADELATLQGLVERVDYWVWITGNHDPVAPERLGGQVASEITIGPLVFRHEALPGPRPGEISGHFHPKASVDTRGGRVSGRCFIEDSNRLILPAFGAYTGGLDIRDPAIRSLFASDFSAHLIGRDRVHRFRSRQLT